MSEATTAKPPRIRTGPILLVVLALGGLAAGYAVSRAMHGGAPASADIPGLLWPEPKALTPFALQATDGKTFDLTRLEGHWTFLFFGYTYCPDVCPTALSTMAQTVKRIADGDRVQVVFVSVDPARDTVERMRDYVEFFDPTFVGATGPLDELEPLTRQLGVLHIRGQADEQGNYDVDHSASLLLVGPKGRLIGIFQAPQTAEEIAGRFNAMRAFIEENS